MTTKELVALVGSLPVEERTILPPRHPGYDRIRPAGGVAGRNPPLSVAVHPLNGGIDGLFSIVAGQRTGKRMQSP
jgi:hypothetical protein